MMTGVHIQLWISVLTDLGADPEICTPVALTKVTPSEFMADCSCTCEPLTQKPVAGVTNCFGFHFQEKNKQHISLDPQSPNRLQEMTDLWLVMFSGGLVASCGSTAWVSYRAQMSRLPAAAGRAAAHGKPVKSRVCAHLAQSRSSHGLVLQPRYFKLFKCITYMQLLREAHIYIHVTHTILQCICAGVGSAQTCNQLWAGSAVVCPMCVNKINV